MTDGNADEGGQWRSSQYALIDFGDGRKLERFGEVVLDRPSPAAQQLRRQSPQAWSQAAIRLEDSGHSIEGVLPPAGAWSARWGPLVFNLKLTPFGHVGLFPEQAPNWHWLTDQLRTVRSPRVLNLFGYTGGSSLAAAWAGAQAVHVDASAPAVKWARRNAADSGLQNAPLRWIVEDARKFATREVRRGNRYEWIVMDPPSYGHGPSGRRWDIQSDLPQLLDDCTHLLTASGGMLVTGHSQQPDEADIRSTLLGLDARFRIDSGRMFLNSANGRQLDAGFFVRATRDAEC